MQPLIYDVAVSADGFISGIKGDISLFPHQGSIVDDYIARLSIYSHCIMGRNTYEFGYQYGLEAGQNPYPSMQSLVVSSSVKLPSNSDVKQISSNILTEIDKLKANCSAPIYLCGGGELAGWLLANNAIDKLRLKRAPILLGYGVQLFGGNGTRISANLTDTKIHDNGIIYQEFDIL